MVINQDDALREWVENNGWKDITKNVKDAPNWKNGMLIESDAANEDCVTRANWW